MTEEKANLIGPHRTSVGHLTWHVCLARWLLRASTSEPAPSASNTSILCYAIRLSLVRVRAPWPQLTWISKVVRIFEAQMICCRLKHKGMNRCDPESLVLTLFGFWTMLTIKVNSAEGNGAKSLYTLMCSQRDMFFHKRFQFVKGCNATNVIEERVVFGDLIQRVERCTADRPRPRFLLGATNVYGSEGPSLKVLTQNVTVLTAARLREVLFHAGASSAGIVALQETRHPTNGFKWANRICSEAGWRIQWSVAPGADRKGVRTPGGTALLWQEALGRGSPLSLKASPAEPCTSFQHRACGRAFESFEVWSVYGDAQRPDLAWLGALLNSAHSSGAQVARPSIVLGDFNWRKAYDKFINSSWTVLPAVRSSKKHKTAPTRCICASACTDFEASIDIVGVPTHLAMVYAVKDLFWTPTRRFRLRRCGSYQWHTAPNLFEQARLQANADQAAPRSCYTSSLREAWAAWHSRAEAVFTTAAEDDLAVCAIRPERAKGSGPTQRPVAEPAHDGSTDTIALRRVRKLRVACEEGCTHLGGGAPLTPSQVKSWKAVIHDKIAKCIRTVPFCQRSAMGTIDAAIADLEARHVASGLADWKRTFRHWGVAALRAGARAIRPGVAPSTFSAHDMRGEWLPIWCRAHPGHDTAEAWRQQARKAGIKAERPKMWQPPTVERFTEALLATDGSAGFDGWGKDEMRALIAHAPWLIDELHRVLIRLTREAPFGISDDLRDAIFTWRVVGIPKRDPSESRPIAIASFIIRAWQKTILDALPPAPEGQWCEIGVLPATASFLAWGDGQPSAGAELDLAKAYDSVLHEPAAAALRHAGTPEVVVAWLCLAWAAKRVCHVDGALAEPIWPSSGILPGDPTSGRVLSVLLRPWHSLMKQQDVHPAAYADDRSIKAVGTTCAEAACKIDKALDTTAQFDEAVGLSENCKKRQRWITGQHAEHLGLNLCLGGTSDGVPPPLPAPRDGWPVIEDLCKRLFVIPGGFQARAGLAASCIIPKHRWAAPFIASPPKSIVQTMMQALLRSACTWWCHARVWAGNIHLHPVLTVAVQALKTAASLPASALLRAAVGAHAASLRLEASWSALGDLWVRPVAGADSRAISAAEKASANTAIVAVANSTPVPPAGSFDPASPAGAHALRVCARVQALAAVRVSRNDCDGLDSADIEASSSAAWQAWMHSLSSDDRKSLRIWRGGAVRSPTL